MHWYWVALGYLSYLAVLAMIRSTFGRARAPSLIAALFAWTSVAAALVFGRAGASLGVLLNVIVPAIVLVIGYRLSGLFFVRPDCRLERWLGTVDATLLDRSGVLASFHRAPRAVAEYFELSYLIVYVLVPAGAAILALAGHAGQIDRFWTIVLMAEFTCYGMLPWIQTRPPRALEATEPCASPAPLMRRLNLTVMNRASIQVNTVPSGHAAGAMAAALAVASTMPATGAVLLILAVSIAVATVLGRYHYLVDSILGVFVALAAWSLV